MSQRSNRSRTMLEIELAHEEGQLAGYRVAQEAARQQLNTLSQHMAEAAERARRLRAEIEYTE